MTVITEMLNRFTLIIGLVIGKTDRKSNPDVCNYLHRVVLQYSSDVLSATVVALLAL